MPNSHLRTAVYVSDEVEIYLSELPVCVPLCENRGTKIYFNFRLGNSKSASL
jgi:hypothetical protein